MSESLNRQLLRITTLLQLEQRARRAATLEELGFAIVNETHALVAYRQAVLWTPGPRGGRIQAVSGIAVPDHDGPYLAWLRRLMTAAFARPEGRKTGLLTAADLPADAGQDWAAGWAEWLPAHVLWVPLPGPDGQQPAVLLLARAEPWTDFDRHLWEYLGEAYGFAWVGLGRRRHPPMSSRRQRLILAGALAALLLVLALPVRQSVLAPAEVVPRNPTLVRAPFDGVVESVVVEPNSPVAAGTLLLTLDRTRLQSRLDIAVKAQEVAEAEYRQAVQEAVFDPKARASLTVLQGRLEQQAGEVRYLESLLARMEVRAPHDGMVMFEDRNDWLGRPVTIGERIMLLADPADMRLDVHLPVADVLDFPEQAEVLLFLNTAPHAPVAAELERISYRASPAPDGTLSYRLKAAITDTDRSALRLGLKGTAKVYGRRVPLGLYIFRRPIAVVRQWLAW